MKEGARSRIGRLATESVVIFASVVLALLADDWRENRNERAEEVRALESIARDLEGEARGLLVYREQLAEEEAAAARFIELASSGGPVDSLVAWAPRALLPFQYTAAHPTYEGLLRGGDLGLIRDAELRDRIVAFHSGRLAYFSDLQAEVEASTRRAVDQLTGYIARTRTDEGDWRFVLVGDPASLGADTRALSALGHAGAARMWLGRRIDGMFHPESEELRRAIEAHLEG